MRTWEELGIRMPIILLPAEEQKGRAWPVVACDQYTSELEYWQDVNEIVGNHPSTFRFILPEVYLEAKDVDQRIRLIHQTMDQYQAQSIVVPCEAGAILVTRTVNGKTRHGLVIAIDLEQYNYAADSTSLIRPTEGTIVERIAPRIRIREKASLETPHVLLLIDDPKKTVIEPLLADEHKPVYDIELMKEGGRLQGEWIPEKELEQVRSALDQLLDDKSAVDHPILFASGDGNHSLATAKAHWENVRATLGEEDQRDHPARFALVEIENIHDEGIVFEPIHRVLLRNSNPAALENIIQIMRRQNPNAIIQIETHLPEARVGRQMIEFFSEEETGWLLIDQAEHQLAVGTLQNALDEYIYDYADGVIDYIHGDDTVRNLSKEGNNVGFALPAIEKSALFTSVEKDGPLPRKTFSMGEANEKRYYMECRRIIK